MRYAYYPGCSSHSTARDMHESATAVAHALGIELVEIEGWSCCGATAAHQTDRVLAASLPAANLLLARQMGLDTVVTCAACYNRMKVANHEVSSSPDMRARVADAVGQHYDGSVAVKHLVEVLIEDIGIDKLRRGFTRSLGGLKVASYYGCLLVRPRGVTNFDDAENPTVIDRLVEAMGGEGVDWPGKVDCCGGSLNLTRTDVVVKLSSSVIDMAVASGAGCIAVACPMCQASLDLRQRDMQKQNGTRYNMPIVYITQLLGLCLGIPPGKLGLDRLMVAPTAVLQALGAKA
jgi:heterodisulfide reductase subunit B2